MECPNKCETIFMKDDNYCSICGCSLKQSNTVAVIQPVAVPRTATVSISNNDSITINLHDDMYDILNEDLLSMIESYMSNALPTRQISQTYLETLGRVILDSKKTLLHDVSIRIGRLSLMGVYASFCSALLDDIIDKQIVYIDDEEHIQQYNLSGKIVCLKRGNTTFYNKALKLNTAGACALIVFNTSDLFPFVMTDSSAATNCDNSSLIPTIMISKKDAEIVEKMLIPANNSSATSTLCNIIHSKEMKTECAICQEEMVEGNTILKLVCNHGYHYECVHTWLESNNTCPLCRREMPLETTMKPKSTTTDSSNSNNRMSYYN